MYVVSGITVVTNLKGEVTIRVNDALASAADNIGLPDTETLIRPYHLRQYREKVYETFQSEEVHQCLHIEKDNIIIPLTSQEVHCVIF